jgi:predicted HAD superfamily Cof-like phosphohydrolase
MSEIFKEVARDIANQLWGPVDNAVKGRIMRDIVPVMKQRLVPLTSDIKEFHERFGLNYEGPPRELDKELLEFRVKFMDEELDEYDQAATDGNLEKQLDALVDLVYVALGTAYMQGFNFAEAWRRVHAANMLKVRAKQPEDSERGSTFDVVKPEGWMPPNLKDLVTPPAPPVVQAPPAPAPGDLL